jgi:hypothetical protein
MAREVAGDERPARPAPPDAGREVERAGAAIEQRAVRRRVRQHGQRALAPAAVGARGQHPVE